jgi:murein L,D-transpeptidase YcbB/YkuD
MKKISLTLFILLSLFIFSDGYGQELALLDPVAVDDNVVSQRYDGLRIEINVAARKLRLYDHGDQLVKTYRIAVGSAKYKTPIGPKVLDQIVWNPWWIPPKSGWAKNSKPTPPGYKNPLGPVKMRIGPAILIHGTNAPNSIGRPASHGCMRMNSSDAVELAWYIQQRLSSQNDPSYLAMYKKHRSRTVYVSLSQSVPVNVVYRLAEVQDGKLHVYQDIYWRGGNKQDQIHTALMKNGVSASEVNLSYIQNLARKGSHRDMVIDLAAPKSPKPSSYDKAIACKNPKNGRCDNI